MLSKEPLAKKIRETVVQNIIIIPKPYMDRYINNNLDDLNFLQDNEIINNCNTKSQLEEISSSSEIPRKNIEIIYPVYSLIRKACEEDFKHVDFLFLENYSVDNRDTVNTLYNNSYIDDNTLKSGFKKTIPQSKKFSEITGMKKINLDYLKNILLSSNL